MLDFECPDVEYDEHIQVPVELAELGGCPSSWGDALELAPQPDKKKVSQEQRSDGLVLACCGMRGWRASNEDASLMMPKGYVGGNWRDATLVGVFDGHGGEQVARFAARTLPTIMAELPSQDAEAAFDVAYRRIDERLRHPSTAAELRELTLPFCQIREHAQNTGSTAVCCLIKQEANGASDENKGTLVLANAGDSRAVLCRQGKAIVLTEDHKPDLPHEEARIVAAGGFVQEGALPGGRGMEYRVNGNLNLSRALGDLQFKEVGKPAHKQVISGVPDTQTLPWRAGEDEFLLLACDGVWECMSAQAVINFVRKRLPPVGSKKKVAPALEELLDACCADTPTQRGGLGCDNVTVVLVRFEDPKEVAANALEESVNDESEQRVLTDQQAKQLENAVSLTLQRLKSGGLKRTESQEERELREAEEKDEQETRERNEKLRIERLKRREEREKLESLKRKRVKFCAAVEDEDEDDEDFDL